MISDFELTNQLYSFMQSIPLLWTQDELIALHENNGSHQETRGPLSKFLQFEMDVLENSSQHGRDYLHIGVFVTDPGRPREAKRGSSWVPLSTSFLWYMDGELDMPSAREIYERS